MDFALDVEYRLGVSIQMSVLPLPHLEVVQVVACFNSPVRLLDQSWPVYFLGQDREDRDLALLQRVRGDDPLLPELFPRFECA